MFFAWSSILLEEEWDEILRLQPVTPRYDEFGIITESFSSLETTQVTTSCSTTRTAKFTGCSATNSATTTGQYCPTGVTIDPNDDQGANGYGAISTSIVTTSIPEIAIVRGEPYTVTGGSINVNGAVIQIPNIGGSEQVSTTIDNVPMVIIQAIPEPWLCRCSQPSSRLPALILDPVPTLDLAILHPRLPLLLPLPARQPRYQPLLTVVLLWVAYRVCVGINVIPQPVTQSVERGKKVMHGAG
ncbi:uncharacterized protein P174DRAFT_465822 [Aspergillus novofumigatus IBT 16806]|uniref:Uncharacterized protein n=1 Tax=Aspergillus novofumigatus (strain IBT 16806) TaxID=1392255 RepID=A0A2I1CKA3_ASPN1|nr:uncharacterized protein P174DRAFT_465822 [Aspergillus novofumigatus IBT 16806]PKX98028.1 hypothetical protein P174DRAFT_465822 [Aspergillus novofumigatus IBT 16806]